ncbi:hypothetical protein LCGC14_0103630 [marine sediment metagenome]|uniref:Uncharacterized protein n=1 Tax=marine sediment metagenome TaxID=412755 RepID=A0A0F9YEN5_9ZZZZ
MFYVYPQEIKGFSLIRQDGAFNIRFPWDIDISKYFLLKIQDYLLNRELYNDPMVKYNNN